MWASIWVLGILWIALSDKIRPLMEALSVGRMLDLTFAFGFLLCLLVTFFSHHKISQMEKRMEELVRAVAIKEGEENEI